MISRLARLFRGEAEQLIAKMERPVPTLNRLKKELFEKAVECHKEYQRLEQLKVSKPETLVRLTKAAEKLKTAAETYKTKYEEIDGLIIDITARKSAAEAELAAMKLLSRHSGGDSLAATLQNVESQVADIERQVQAYEFMEV